MDQAWQSEAGNVLPILSVRDLTVQYRTPAGVVHAVRGVSFDLYPNQSIALIGESGCGKTTLGLALLRLLPHGVATISGQILYRKRDGTVLDLMQLNREELRRFRWRECSMVFQGALNALNPVLRIRNHFEETARAHGSLSRAELQDRSVELLRMVQLDPDRVLSAYPHELSGGMRQRVMIALSLLLNPRVIIYDEPTTALDILTQRAIIEVLRDLRRRLTFSMIFISHDLPLAAELADHVATMYAGKIVEFGEVKQIFYAPRHPYTNGLIHAIPSLTGDLVELGSIPGSPPSLLNPPSGCSFQLRCPYQRERCVSEEPPLYRVTWEHHVACHYWQLLASERRVVASDD